jgi:predicted transcriptional regulator
MKTGRKNTLDAVANRRATVARLFLQGMWQADIAKHVNVTQQQVSKDIQVIRALWSKSMVEDYNQKVDEELAKINLLEQEYHEAWSRSKEQFKSRSIKGRAIGEENPTQLVEKHERTEERVGDPRYLQGIQWCIEQRCKIMGIPDKAPKQEVVHSLDLTDLSDEQLRLLSEIKSKIDV